jgi:uncharacterized protein YicC (UPF0701 family)
MNHEDLSSLRLPVISRNELVIDPTYAQTGLTLARNSRCEYRGAVALLRENRSLFSDKGSLFPEISEEQVLYDLRDVKGVVNLLAMVKDPPLNKLALLTEYIPFSPEQLYQSTANKVEMFRQVAQTMSEVWDRGYVLRDFDWPSKFDRIRFRNIGSDPNNIEVAIVDWNITAKYSEKGAVKDMANLRRYMFSQFSRSMLDENGNNSEYILRGGYEKLFDTEDNLLRSLTDDELKIISDPRIRIVISELFKTEGENCITNLKQLADRLSSFKSNSVFDYIAVPTDAYELSPEDLVLAYQDQYMDYLLYQKSGLKSNTKFGINFSNIVSGRASWIAADYTFGTEDIQIVKEIDYLPILLDGLSKVLSSVRHKELSNELLEELGSVGLHSLDSLHKDIANKRVFGLRAFLPDNVAKLVEVVVNKITKLRSAGYAKLIFSAEEFDAEVLSLRNLVNAVTPLELATQYQRFIDSKDVLSESENTQRLKEDLSLARGAFVSVLENNIEERQRAINQITSIVGSKVDKVLEIGQEIQEGVTVISTAELRRLRESVLSTNPSIVAYKAEQRIDVVPESDLVISEEPSDRFLDMLKKLKVIFDAKGKVGSVDFPLNYRARIINIVSAKTTNKKAMLEFVLEDLGNEKCLTTDERAYLFDLINQPNFSQMYTEETVQAIFD